MFPKRLLFWLVELYPLSNTKKSSLVSEFDIQCYGSLIKIFRLIGENVQIILRIMNSQTGKLSVFKYILILYKNYSFIPK